MPRKPRIEYAGALYHVMSRGDRGEAIYGNDADRTIYLCTLGEVCERTGWKLHAYVLMPNHYHLLVETPEANLVAGMRWLQGTYTQRYNARYRQHGHLFQGRYKAVMIEPDEQAFTARVSTYIHLNPLRAGLIRWPEEKLGAYVWSSYPAYIGQVHAPTWLELGRVWGSQGFEGRRGNGRKYGRMLERLCREWATAKGRKLIMGDWNALRRGWCLGDESFREQMAEALERVVAGKRRETYGGDEMREHDERAAERLLVKGLERLGLKREALEGLKKGDARKKVLAWWLKSRTTVSVVWIQEQLKLGFRTSVSNAVACVKSGDDPELLRLRSVVMSD